MDPTLLNVEPAYLQILSLGFFWTLLHCAPMCGPIVGAIQLPQSTGGNRLLALVYYQAGRGIMYVFFGALAGYFASSENVHFKNVGWFIVIFLSLAAFYKLSPLRLRSLPLSPLFIKILQPLQKLPSGWRPFTFGVFLSFLPCMLTFWALNLAATTQNAWKGAFTMLLLIAITSVPLYASIFLGSWLTKLKMIRLEGWLLLLSAIWCFLMTAAANQWIDHYYYDFEFNQQIYTIMFW